MARALYEVSGLVLMLYLAAERALRADEVFDVAFTALCCTWAYWFAISLGKRFMKGTDE